MTRPRSPIVAITESIRTVLGAALLWAIASGFFYGWVFGAIAVGAIITIGAIAQPLLEADWEGLLTPEVPRRVLVQRKSSRTQGLVVTQNTDRQPPSTHEVLDPSTLKLLENSYRHLGCPMGEGERGFYLWLAEYTAWAWDDEDNRWLAILPQPVVEVEEAS